jgi:hypothetical protein
VQNVSNDRWNGLQTTQNRLSVYGNNQTTTNNLETLRAATTGAPLPCGNALVTYQNLRQEKKCAGKKSEYEVMRDINVVNA